MISLSIVIQGQILDGRKEIDQTVIANIARTRMLFPLAEIVISTWTLSEALREDFTMQTQDMNLRVVWNTDPGEIHACYRGIRVASNINRLQTSSFSGIKAASGVVVIKTRTDCCFENRHILSLISTYFSPRSVLEQESAYRVFQRHVINANLYARSPQGIRPFLYHPGDIVLIGYRDDLLSFFDTPLANSSLMDPYAARQPYAPMRRVPEQYFWMNCISKASHRTITDRDLMVNPYNCERSNRYYVSNFVPLTLTTLGIRWDKLRTVYRWKDRWLSIYLPAEWQVLYSRFIRGVEPAFSAELFLRQTLIFVLRPLSAVRNRLLSNCLTRALIVKLFGRHRRGTEKART